MRPQRKCLDDDDLHWVLHHPGLSSTLVEENHLDLERIKALSREIGTRKHKTADMRCVLYATKGKVMNVWMSPYAQADKDMLDVSAFFPNGALSTRISNIPGTRRKLDREWRIIISKNGSIGPVNKAIRHKFGIEWRGNVVLAEYWKTKCHDRDKMKNLPNSHQEFATLILNQWFDYIQKLSMLSKDL